MPFKKLQIEINNSVGYLLLASGVRFNKLTSEPYTAAEALRMGLVDRVYSGENLWTGVKLFAERIAGHSSNALGAAKKVLNASEDISLKNGCELEAALTGNLWKVPVTTNPSS